ncbi:carbohydrate binding domain-containing protein [Rugamonas rubra]|uniref:Carbohydrate binding domain-containing protein n=1 Tax=Rugamonas rubra TaxID=758825 RepID=A0A1I4RG86_9BURK|nr:carbohydrate binding domain-containing protein [Rugamonas rubra]SFM51217.1 Carbohydrate binding domain-containing protein [Rugamonas rubra]
MRRSKLSLAVITLLSSLTSHSAFAENSSTPSCVNCFEKRWVYFGGNVALDADFQKLKEIIVRAKAAGYNGIALNSSGYGSYGVMIQRTGSAVSTYYGNFKAIVDFAKSTGIELIPVGGGPEVPAVAAPQLVEALPVQETPFLVHDGKAVPLGQSIVTDSSFENNDGAWKLFDTASGGVSFDTSVAHTGNRSIKFTQASTTNLARIHRELVGLRKHSAYRMSFWVKTENYDAPLRIQIHGADTSQPIYSNASAGLGWGTDSKGQWNKEPNGFAATQEWTKYDIDFNTGNFDRLKFYLGSWSNGKYKLGKAWLDDVEINEIGLAHTVRRTDKSLPVIVQSEDRSITYVESKDYVVEVGSLTLPQESSIREGDVLRVSAYQSGRNMTSAWSTPASACHQSFFDIQKEYFDKVYGLLDSPKKFFLYYDENRLLNWDPVCPPGSAGEYLANMFKKHQDTLAAGVNKPELYVWNDMFDPYVNAVPVYWAVNGDLRNSWKGLNTDTTVVNWSNPKDGKSVDSLKFFAGHGNKQMIAGYYDVADLTNVRAWMQSLSEAEKNGVTGVNGFMYTTFDSDKAKGYGALEDVAEFIKQNYSARWPK